MLSDEVMKRLKKFLRKYGEAEGTRGGIAANTRKVYVYNFAKWLKLLAAESSSSSSSSSREVVMTTCTDIGQYIKEHWSKAMELLSMTGGGE